MLAIDDPNAIRIFEELMRDIARQEIRKASFNYMLSAKVISADNVALTADIQLLNDTSITILGVKNRSGFDLSTNDIVWVEFLNGSNSNFMITIKD